jgi:hypothetical protein
MDLFEFAVRTHQYLIISVVGWQGLRQPPVVQDGHQGERSSSSKARFAFQKEPNNGEPPMHGLRCPELIYFRNIDNRTFEDTVLKLSLLLIYEFELVKC